MISKVSIQNFKCLREVQTDLELLTVFVGPNASGKTSILQALDFLCRAFRSPEESLENEISQAQCRGSHGQVELAAEFKGKGYRYRTRDWFSDYNPHLSIPEEKKTGQEGSEDGCGIAPSFISNDWKEWKAQSTRLSPLPLSRLLRLETSKLILPNPGAPDPAIMAADGTGLHSALAGMALNDPDSWQQLQADLRRVIPSIRRLRHTRTVNHQSAALLFDTLGADSLLAHQISEGTLLVLGILAALHAAGRPNLVLLDDLDRGLHPRAQQELIVLLRGLLETNPNLQILATTHSPYLLDCLSPNEVRMTILRDDGATACAPLASHPNFAKWKDEMTPGEMWSLFGEKWLLEKEAAT